MIRKVIITALTLAAIATGSIRVWSVTWDGRPAWFAAKLGTVTLLRGHYGFLLGITVGVHPRWGNPPVVNYGLFLYSRGKGGLRVEFPYWAPVALFAAYPTLALTRTWLRRRTLMRRRLRGLCVRCGYDIRKLPEPRCPECGTAIEPVSADLRTAKARRIMHIGLLCVLLGMACALLSLLLVQAVASSVPTWLNSRLSQVPVFFDAGDVVIAYGCLLGIFWFALAFPLLHRKSIRRIAHTFGLMTGLGGPALVAISCLARQRIVPTEPCYPSLYYLATVLTLTFVVTGLLLRRTLPDVYPPGFCNTCNCEIIDNTLSECLKCGAAVSR